MTKINDILRIGVLADLTASKLYENRQIKGEENLIFKQSNNNLYEIDSKKKKKLSKVYANDYKKTMPKKHKWVFTFYIISIVLFLATIISTLACLVCINDMFDKVSISCIILFFGLGLNCIPYSAYKFSLNSQAFGDFYYLKNEKILITENGFNYYYYDSRYNYIEEVSMFKFQIDYKNIKYVGYDKRVGEFFIYGNIDVYEYKNNGWKLIEIKNKKDNSTPTGVVMQNIYQIDLLELFRKNNLSVEDYHYLNLREKELQTTKESI